MGTGVASTLLPPTKPYGPLKPKQEVVESALPPCEVRFTYSSVGRLTRLLLHRFERSLGHQVQLVDKKPIWTVQAIRVIGRNTQGVHLLRLDEGSIISSITRVMEKDDGKDEAEETDQNAE